MKLLWIFLMILAAFYSNAAVRYVSPLGSGNHDGSSWSNSFPGDMLQDAINGSTPGDDIWVASGTYFTTTGLVRTISISMKNGVGIYGSFNGTENSISERILTNGPTSIISGNIGEPGIIDNSFHIIHNYGLDNSAVIDGFIIRDANDDRPPGLIDGLGGGIYNDGSGSGNSCSPVIRNCVIINNHASFGGGIFNNGYQGGISEPDILSSVIAFNTATGGAGIDNFGLGGNASPRIENCVVYANTATERAGGMYCWGGNNGNANPLVLNTVFANNVAPQGGAIVSDRLNSGSGSSGASNPDFRNCIFKGNEADLEGPQFIVLGDATFTATYSCIDLTGQSAPNIITGPGIGNITSDPLFEDIEDGRGSDNLWMTQDDGLKLQLSSPCIDSGENSGVFESDIIGNQRIINSIVDIGAYEYQGISTSVNATGNASMVYPNPTTGDLILPGFYSTNIPVRIIDQHGKTIKEIIPYEGKITLIELPPGIYTIVQELGVRDNIWCRIIKQ